MILLIFLIAVIYLILLITVIFRIRSAKVNFFINITLYFFFYTDGYFNVIPLNNHRNQKNQINLRNHGNQKNQKKS